MLPVWLANGLSTFVFLSESSVCFMARNIETINNHRYAVSRRRNNPIAINPAKSP